MSDLALISDMPIDPDSSAGVRDSALTNHGVLQAARLGSHLTSSGIVFTHIFSSNLSRAYKTAEALRAAQPKSDKCQVVSARLEELREQDFGSYEGTSHKSLDNAKYNGKNISPKPNLQDPDFRDIESKDSLACRANKFLDEHISPLMAVEPIASQAVVVIVSHGILLSSLWRCLLRRLPPNSVTIDPKIQPILALEHLGGWSNTGYLSLDLRFNGRLITQEQSSVSIHRDDQHNRVPTELLFTPHVTETFRCYLLIIRAINCKDHLRDLKRTRGGVGSSRFDEGQKLIHTFFKKQRVS